MLAFSRARLMLIHMPTPFPSRAERTLLEQPNHGAQRIKHLARQHAPQPTPPCHLLLLHMPPSSPLQADRMRMDQLKHGAPRMQRHFTHAR